MIRLQNKTPEIYCNQSRDFQLFCRLYDVIINGVRFDIQSMLNLLDADKVNDRMLELFCTKVGFFHRSKLNANVLRTILKSFPYVLKYKGSKQGIEAAVSAILKVERILEAPRIDINIETYEVIIQTKTEIKNKTALYEYLDYIMPAGFTYRAVAYLAAPSVKTDVTINSDINTAVNPSIASSQVAGTNRLVYNTPTSDTDPLVDTTDFAFKDMLLYNNSGTVGSIQVMGGSYVSNHPTALTSGSWDKNVLNAKEDNVDKRGYPNGDQNGEEENS